MLRNTEGLVGGFEVGNKIENEEEGE